MNQNLLQDGILKRITDFKLAMITIQNTIFMLNTTLGNDKIFEDNYEKNISNILPMVENIIRTYGRNNYGENIYGYR